MFQVEDEFTYSWPVTVRRPSKSEPGTFEEFEFIAQFRAWSDDDAEAYTKEVEADAAADKQTLRRDELLYRVLVGWGKVAGPDGKALTFSADALKRMLQHPWNRIALYEAWRASNTPEARRAGN